MCGNNKELTIEEKRDFLYKKVEQLKIVSRDIKKLIDQDIEAYKAASNIGEICRDHYFDSPLETFRVLAIGLLRQKELEIQKDVDQYIK